MGFIHIRSNILVILSCAVLFILSFSLLTLRYQSTSGIDSIGGGETDPDILDYHFISVNFALTNQFPVTGYILDTSIYKIQYDKTLDDLFLNMFKKNGSVTTFARPPLYPLVLGCIYKIFGYKIYFVQRLNILLLSLIISLTPLVGFKTWGMIGYWAGLIGSGLFAALGCQNYLIETVDVEIFIAFVFFLLSSIGLILRVTSRPFLFFAFGLSIGLGLLAKPVIVAFPFLYASYLLLKHSKSNFRPILVRIAVLFVGVFLVILPYTIYINHQHETTIDQREAWIKRVSATMSNIEYNDYSEMPPCNINDFDQCIPVFKDYIKTMFITHCSTRSFIIITNSGGPQLFYQNNELSIDGKPLHFEWAYVKNSFYRKYFANEPVMVKLFHFYSKYPSYIFRIPMARLSYTAGKAPLLYWLSAALFGLCIIQRRQTNLKNKKMKGFINLLIFMLTAASLICSFIIFQYATILLFVPLFLIGILLYRPVDEQKIPVVFPTLWMSLFLFVFVLYGHERFTRVANPLVCLSIGYYAILMITTFINPRMSDQE